MKFVNSTLALVMAVSLTACMASAPKKSSGAKRDDAMTPEWVNNAPERNGFAYGVGSADLWGDKADAIRRAGDAARVNLVSQLRVTVSGDFSSDIQERKATGKQTELVQTVRNTIRSQVPAVELDEVQITESYLEKKFAYALAELDRAKAAARLRDQITDLEEQIKSIGAKPRTGTALQKVRVVLPALKLFAQRERFADQLALVSIQRQKPALDGDLQDLQQTIFSLLDQLQVRIATTDAGAENIAGGVIESLTEQGIRINDSGAYDLLVEVAAKLRPAERGGSHFVFADSRVMIKDENGRVLSTFSKQAKGASSDAGLAQDKAARNVAKALAKELAVTLVDKID